MILLTVGENWWTGFEIADQDMMKWLSIVQAVSSAWKKQISNYGKSPGKRISDKTLANIVIPSMKVKFKEVYSNLLNQPCKNHRLKKQSTSWY